MTNEEAKVFLDNLKICINEHPIVADWLVEIADRKTEPSGYNLSPIDKDINVRSKDEPQTHDIRTETHECVKDSHDKTEPQTTDYCDVCNHKGCDNCVADGSNPYCVPSQFEPMTLNEAIRHAEQIADSYKDTEPNCKCAEEHRQLAEWLKELRERRAKDEPQTESVGVPFGLMDEATFKSHCLNCQRDTADIKCLDCDGNKYFLPYGSQTDCAWK